MTHGRDHEQREQKHPPRRTRQAPESDSFEAEMLSSGRHGATPRQGVIGAHTERNAPAGDDLDEEEQPAGGSDVAPTAKAAEREAERHRLERQAGRRAAGGTKSKAKVAAGTTRKALDEAAAQADRKVGASDAPRAGRGGQEKPKPTARAKAKPAAARTPTKEATARPKAGARSKPAAPKAAAKRRG